MKNLDFKDDTDYVDRQNIRLCMYSLLIRNNIDNQDVIDNILIRIREIRMTLKDVAKHKIRLTEDLKEDIEEKIYKTELFMYSEIDLKDLKEKNNKDYKRLFPELIWE